MRAIVTGAARGLGAAIADRLVRGGTSVALVDVAPAVKETAIRLSRIRPDVTAFGLIADVSEEVQCGEAVTRAVTELGGIDVLVNNAGIGGPATSVVDTALADFHRVIEVNLTGAFLASRAVAPVMIAQGTGGAIVNLGSIFGQQGVDGGAGYCASKAGVALLTHSLALELARHRIRVNTVAPGHMATDMHWAELRSRAAALGTTFEEQVARVRESVPLGRHGTGEDVAGAVVWLMSADAAYVTGQTIGVNGGVWLS
jgi:NAD(P)-dependent dehydrogenase (short-subunit alcohol dehydrogenase family)